MKRLRQVRLLVSLTAGMVVIGALSYYLIDWVPDQREYLVNLRFRSLAVIGNQIQSKLQHMASAMEYFQLEHGSDAGKWPEYARQLVPDLESPSVTGKPAGNPSRAAIRLDLAGRAPLLIFQAGVLRAESPVSRVFSPFLREELFDDLAVAARDGTVLYQVSGSSPRILNVARLREQREAAKAGGEKTPRQGDGISAGLLDELELDGTRYLLLIQPVRVGMAPDGGEGLELAICGLVKASRIRAEATHVPPKHLLWIVVPLLVLVLSGPFLKLAMLTRTARIRFMDAFLLAMSSIFVTGFVAVSLGCLHHYGTQLETLDGELRSLAESIDKKTREETKFYLTRLEAIDAYAATLGNAMGEETDLWASTRVRPPLAAPLDMDFVFWTDENGCQTEKWTTKTRATARVNQMREEYFTNLLGGITWRVNGAKPALPDYSLQVLTSPTTAELIVALGIPTKRVSATPCPTRGAEGVAKPKAATIVATPRSVVSPVLPPGTSFAILDVRGRVIFHSRQERNLHEDFYRECRDSEGIERAVARGTAESFPLYYRGREYLAHVRPLSGIAGMRRSVITLAELEPLQAHVLRTGFTAGVLFLYLLMALGGIFLLQMGMLRHVVVSHSASWKRFAIEQFWPRAELLRSYRLIAGLLAALAIFGLAVLHWSGGGSYSLQGWVLVESFLLPFAALTGVLILLVVAQPVQPKPGDIGKARRTYALNLLLATVIAGALPVTGFLQVCRKYENRAEMKWRQRDLVQRIEERQRRLKAQVEGAASYSEAGKHYVRASVLPAVLSLEPGAPHNYYASFAATEVRLAKAGDLPPGSVGGGWWEGLLDWLSAGQFMGAREAEIVHAESLEDDAWIWRHVAGTGGTELLRLARGTGQPGEVLLVTSVPREPQGIAPMLPLAPLLLLLLWWWVRTSAHKLFLWSITPLTLRTPAEAFGPAGCQSNLLLLGLPLAGKDQEVIRHLGLIPRINLHSEKFCEGWLDRIREMVLSQLAPPAEAVAVTASGSGTATGAAPALAADRRRWVHISNLEAKIGEHKDRQVVLDLLEWLLKGREETAGVGVVITSAVDPMTHFDAILKEEKKARYENSLPEHELQRWARVLSKFETLVMPKVPSPEPPSRDAWTLMLWSECHSHKPLLWIRQRLLAERPPAETLLVRIEEYAQSFYRLVWASCTRSEKLLLIQLATTGLVNPAQNQTLQDLLHKHLVIMDPSPRLMNTTFERFLLSVESAETVAEWEKEGGESAWPVVRNSLAAVLVIAVLLFAATQQHTLQAVVAVATAAVGALTGIFKLLEFLTGHRAAKAAAE